MNTKPTPSYGFVKQAPDSNAARIMELETQVAELREALTHCVMVFKSMADRGDYPMELLPDEQRHDAKKLYLGKQGFKFALDALGVKSCAALSKAKGEA